MLERSWNGLGPTMIRTIATRPSLVRSLACGATALSAAGHYSTAMSLGPREPGTYCGRAGRRVRAGWLGSNNAILFARREAARWPPQWRSAGQVPSASGAANTGRVERRLVALPPASAAQWRVMTVTEGQRGSLRWQVKIGKVIRVASHSRRREVDH